MNDNADDPNDGYEELRGENQVDLTTIQAIDGKRSASINMWEKVQSGNLDRDVLLWLQHVAANVLDAESKNAGAQRNQAIVNALGLSGGMDEHIELREFAFFMRGFGVSRKCIIDTLTNPKDTDLSAYPWMTRYKGGDPFNLAKTFDRELEKIVPKPT